MRRKMFDKPRKEIIKHFFDKYPDLNKEIIETAVNNGYTKNGINPLTFSRISSLLKNRYTYHKDIGLSRKKLRIKMKKRYNLNPIAKKNQLKATKNYLKRAEKENPNYLILLKIRKAEISYKYYKNNKFKASIYNQLRHLSLKD